MMMTSLLDLLRAPLRRVRSRIILPFVLLTLLFAGAGGYFLTGVVAGSLQERFDRQLLATGRSVADELVRQEQQQLATVRAMSATEGVAAAAGQGDGAAARALLAPLVANSRIDWAGAVTADGRTLFATARDPGSRDDYSAVTAAGASAWWPVSSALAGADARGDKFASLVQTEYGFVLLTAAPVYDGDRIVGVAFAGTYLGTLVERLRASALGDVTVFDYTGAPLASTLAAPDEWDSVLAVSPDDLAGTLADEGTVRRAHLAYAGRDYDLAYGLLRVRGNVVGVYSVALPSDFITAAGARTRLELSVFVVVAVAAVMLIGYVVSQRITDPIVRLVHAARRISEGHRGVRSGIRSADEIGVLASTFDRMAEDLETYADRLRRQHVGTVKALTSAIDARDPYTLGHSMRVGQLSRELARQMELPEALLTDIEIGGYLHDIGKIGVRDSVLLKPSTLTPDERSAIERHPAIGASILASVEVSSDVLAIVRSHHERIDGSGYPDALPGDQQSIVVRIAAVADVYDALMTERPYKPAMAVSDVLAVIQRQAGVTLDADVVAALVEIAPAWEARVASDPALQGIGLDEGQRVAARRAA